MINKEFKGGVNMIKGLADKVLFEGEADEYAEIIDLNVICHDDCMEILRVVASLKNKGKSNKIIIDKLMQI